MNKEYTVNRLLSIRIFVLFAIIYCLISLVNHHQFRTCALDLGMFNQALYYFANFKNAYFTLGIDGIEMPFLGTHFSLIMILFSPFYFLFGSYTLLIIQIVAILLGGLGIYKYAKSHFRDDSIIPVLVLVQFFSIWGIFSALSFDFHCSVIGAMLIIWFVYFVEKRMLIQASIILLLVLFSTEIMSIWAFFIITGLIIKNWRVSKNEYLRFEVPAAIFCLLYAVIVIGIIMPSLQGVENNLQFEKYSHFGNSFGDIVKAIIQKPLNAILLFFANTTGYAVYDGIKQELFLMVFVSGGIALLFRPIYLFMLIPIFAQKLLSNDYGLWGINGHYSIEFVPILSLATVDLIQHSKKHKIIIAVIISLSTIIFTINSINHRVSKWYNKTNSKFYSCDHYDSEFDVEKVSNALMLIPNKAKVSVSSCLSPHLAFREKLYHFPIIKDADYIVLATSKRKSYPLSEEDFVIKIKELRNSDVYSIIFDDLNILIFKRVTNYKEL